MTDITFPFRSLWSSLPVAEANWTCISSRKIWQWSFSGGGTISQIKDDACKNINHYKRKYHDIHVYFLVGIPDITTIVKRGAYQETILVPSKEELTMTFNEKILDLTSVVKKAASRVCLCKIAPMDIEKWNKHRLYKKKRTHLKHQANYKEMQNTLDEAIIQINKFIVEINITNHMITPFIADTVFTKKKGSRNKKFYSKLPDGLHPGEDLCTKWGEQIAQRIDANLSVSMSAATAPLPLTCRIKKETPEDDHSPSRPRKREWKTYWGWIGYDLA